MSYYDENGNGLAPGAARSSTPRVRYSAEDVLVDQCVLCQQYLEPGPDVNVSPCPRVPLNLPRRKQRQKGLVSVGGMICDNLDLHFSKSKQAIMRY